MENTGVRFLFIGIVCVSLAYAYGRQKCGDLEVSVNRYAPLTDRFCKPWITMATELYKPRWCVCKEGYIRNAWGECIEESRCLKCMHIRNVDYNECSSACPIVCGKRPPTVCTDQCVVGCACAPGFVLDPWQKKNCIPVAWCPPTCQRYSVFRTCTSTCPQTCDQPQRRHCETRCHDGECVCLPGFYKKTVRGEDKCVPWRRCSERAE
uniref:TIL domain containing protein n=1 Tax=Rhipicephalus zambeziensis TaxID=60191 RepID=A0A224YRS8_9ACAR